MVLLDWLRARWLRILVHAGALLPLVRIIWDYTQGGFLVDPVREITRHPGHYSSSPPRGQQSHSSSDGPANDRSKVMVIVLMGFRGFSTRM